MLVTQKFGPEILVNTVDVGDQSRSTIASRPDGRFLVSWVDLETSAIKAQLFDALAEKIGPEFLVKAGVQPFPGAAGPFPGAAALTDGNFVIAWEGNGIEGQLLSANGDLIGSEFPIGRGAIFRTSVTALAGGGFIVGWTGASTEPSGFTLPDARARILNASGMPLGESFFLSTTTNGIESNPTTAALPDGGFVATWMQYPVFSLEYRIMLQFFDASGTKLGAEHGVAASQLGALMDPVIASIGHDRLAVVYTEGTLPAASETSYLQILDASGALLGDRVPLTTIAGSQSSPAIAAMPDGNFIVTWTGTNTQGPDTDGLSVWAQVFDPDANRVGEQLLVNTETKGHQFISMGAALPDESFAVVWWDESGAGTKLGTSVKLQLFALANAVTGTPGGEQLYGTDGDDFIDALAGPDRLMGLEGNDFLHGGPDTGYLDGGPGIDTAIFDYDRSTYGIYTYFDPNGGGLGGGYVTTLSNRFDQDAFISIEHVRFAGVDVGRLGPQQNNLSNVSGGIFDDVVFQSASTGQLIYAGMRDGAFSGWGAIAGPGASWKAVATANDHDHARVFAQNADDAGPSDGAIWGYRLTGPYGASAEVVASLPATWKLVGAADIEGDAYGDPIVQDNASGSLYFIDAYLSSFSAPTVIYDHLTTDWIVVGAGDVNGDDFADIVIQDQTTGTVYFADMAGGIFNAWGVVSFGLTPDWRVRAVADVNGDRYADVITQDQATGTTYYADMRGGVFDHWGIVTVGVDATWVAHGAGDVDNDGDRDVLLQHTTDGLTYYARMGSTGFEAWGTVAPASTDWVLL